jgi:hypothetical protein
MAGLDPDTAPDPREARSEGELHDPATQVFDLEGSS